MDSGLAVKHVNDIALEYKAFTKFEKAHLITADQAQKTASEYFTAGYKTPAFQNLLIYDTAFERLIWEIRRYKGFMNVTIEKIYIDAEDAEFLYKKTESIRRFSIWQAIFRSKFV